MLLVVHLLLLLHVLRLLLLLLVLLLILLEVAAIMTVVYLALGTIPEEERANDVLPAISARSLLLGAAEEGRVGDLVSPHDGVTTWALELVRHGSRRHRLLLRRGPKVLLHSRVHLLLDDLLLALHRRLLHLLLLDLGLSHRLLLLLV